MEELIKQYGTLGVGGFLTIGALWLIRHLITVTIPDMNKQAATERANEAAQRQASHEKVMENINDKHEAVMGELTEQRQEMIQGFGVLGWRKGDDRPRAGG